MHAWLPASPAFGCRRPICRGTSRGDNPDPGWAVFIRSDFWPGLYPDLTSQAGLAEHSLRGECSGAYIIL